MQITKNATDNSFDERCEFGHTITEGGFAHTTEFLEQT